MFIAKYPLYHESYAGAQKAPAERRVMKPELFNGYFIEPKPNEFDLKLTYQGQRNGKSCTCIKTIGHFPDIKSAVKRFLSLNQIDKTDDRFVSLQEYVNAVEASNTKAVQSIVENNLEYFYTYVPKGKGKVTAEGKSIIDFIPFGKENAISRPILTSLCVEHGLIEKQVRDKDRIMRSLVREARFDYAIINDQDAKGYYRPTAEDYNRVRKHIAQEKCRAFSTLAPLKVEEALCEDIKAGRL